MRTCPTVGRISIHAPREGSDRLLPAHAHGMADFYPRSPRGERRPAFPSVRRTSRQFLSTLPARGATIYSRFVRMELYQFLSTLPARGATQWTPGRQTPTPAFLSTLPARGATRGGWLGRRIQQDFYPRSPRGERPGPGSCRPCTLHFYPRSPRGERQALGVPIRPVTAQFLSTLPARGATQGAVAHLAVGSISIHAPREGSDDRKEQLAEAVKEFLSTLPARGATTGRAFNVLLRQFLSTLPARGATETLHVYRSGQDDFYPRSPRGERRWTTRCWTLWIDFYPRSPRGERLIRALDAMRAEKFLSTLPARGATPRPA